MKSVKLCIATCVIAGLLIGGCNKSSEKTTGETKPAATAKAATPTPAPAPAPAPKPAEAPKPAVTPAPAATTPTSGKFVLRVNCGGEAQKDKAGNQWVADQDFVAGKWGAVDGSTSDRTGLGVKGTDNPAIYETERYSMESYKFTVPNGTYTVKMHFAETYEGIGAAGDRVFDVSLQGKPVLTNFDAFKEGKAAATAVVKEFKDVQVTNGQIVIGFTPKVENPEINGIEILQQ